MESLKKTTGVQLVPFNKKVSLRRRKIGFSTDHPATNFNAPYLMIIAKFDDAKSFIESSDCRF